MNLPIHPLPSNRPESGDGSRKQPTSSDLSGSRSADLNLSVALETLIARSLTPQDLEIRLGQLIRRYLSQRSVALADAVVRHIEILCAHPDYTGCWEERCAYRRLAWHWRGLAQFITDPPVRPPLCPSADTRRQENGSCPVG